jgi:hypothetical protein
MTDGARYLPLLALAIPLLGAGALAVWPARERLARFERPLFLASLALSLALLVVAGLGRTMVVQFPFWGEPFLLGRALGFTMDYLSLMCAMLLIGSLLAVALDERPEETQREAAVVALFVGGAGVAVLLAANMATLCLAWVFLDLALLWIDTRHASRSGAVGAVRNLFLRTASTIALVAATVLVLAQQGDAPIPLLEAEGLARPLLMATALLRIGLYPLPGGLERTWLAYLVSATTGGYLWLRLASLSVGGLPGAGWLLPVAGTVLLLTGVLAALSGEEPAGEAYLLSHWLALLVLAPLVQASGGVRVGLAAVVNIALAVVPLAAAASGVRRGLAWRLPALVRALAAGGGPLTVGFLARWAFLRVAWEEGHTGLFAVAVAAFALASVPAWRQASLAPAPPETAGDGAPPAPDAAPSERPAARIAALVGGYLPAVVLVVGGTAPALLGAIGARLISRFSLPLAEGYGAVSWAGAPAYAAAAALLVLAVGYVLARGIAGGRPSPARLTAHTFLEMDWLYSSAERTLAWTEAAIARGAAVIEEGPAALGWILLWLLAGLFLLTGR